MSDLIDRDALRLMKVKECAGHTIEYAEGWKACIEWIKTLPSAEPERPKGEWIDGLPYINSHWWVCSVCHVSVPENHTGYNFCPSCGADMRGEQDG